MTEITLTNEEIARALSERDRLERLAASVGLTPNLDQMRPKLVFMLLIIARQQDVQGSGLRDMQASGLQNALQSSLPDPRDPEDPHRLAQLAARLGVRYDGADDQLFGALIMLARLQDAACGRELPAEQLHNLRDVVSSYPAERQDEMREHLLREEGIDLVSNHGRSLA